MTRLLKRQPGETLVGKPLNFKNYQAYLAAFLEARNDGRDLSIVSLFGASRIRGVSKQAITNAIQRQTLTGVKIGKTQCVLMDDLVIEHEAKTADYIKTVSLIEKKAARGSVLEYGKGMEAIGLDHTLSWQRNRYAKLLETISRESYEEHGILLTALVVRKGSKSPSNGFFTMARGLGFTFEDTPTGRATFAAKQMAKVWNHYKK